MTVMVSFVTYTLQHRFAGKRVSLNGKTWQVGRAGGGKRRPAGALPAGAQSQVQVAAPATRMAVAPAAARLNSSTAAASCLPAGPPALPSEAAPRLLFLGESPR